MDSDFAAHAGLARQSARPPRLLLALALTKFAEENRPTGVFVTAEAFEVAEEFVENWEVELDVLQPLQIESLASDAAIPYVGVLALGDLTLAAELASQDSWGELPLPQTTLGEIGFLFGADGAGMADIGEGLKAATFFGARSRGERFVFVVDNSNSMIRGRFETALLELIRTVDNMTPKQQFYVIFFSDTAYRMFHPNPGAGPGVRDGIQQAAFEVLAEHRAIVLAHPGPRSGDGGAGHEAGRDLHPGGRCFHGRYDAIAHRAARPADHDSHARHGCPAAR